MALPLVRGVLMAQGGADGQEGWLCCFLGSKNLFSHFVRGLSVLE